MKAGRARVDALGDIHFSGDIGWKIAKYCRDSRDLAHDMGVQVDRDASRLHRAIMELRKNPWIKGRRVKMWWRSQQVVRHLYRARNLSEALMSESEKLYAQYRQDFVEDVKEAPRHSRSGRVRL